MAAVGWLERHDAVDAVPGFEDAPPSQGWKEGLRFYYFQALSRCLPLLSETVARERRERLLTTLVRGQRDDGCWQNDSTRMREDDPLIATSFAVVALGQLLDPSLP